MTRIVHEFAQGSPEWHQHRETHYNASDVPAMLGISPYKKRSDLVREYATGIRPDVDPETQKRFDDGHRYEAAARPIAEEIIGEALYPQVMSMEVDGLPLSASLDGITMGEDFIFEHKTTNVELREDFAAGRISKVYASQMEQQLLISGAERCLFMASNGTEDTEQHDVYVSSPNLRAEILAGWKQFAEDVKNYKPEPVAEVVTAAPIERLPAIRVELTGAVVFSNLTEFEEAAKRQLATIKTDLVTDQDFVDADAMVKNLAAAEKEIEVVKKAALAQTADIEALFRSLDNIAANMKSTRIALDKKVESQKTRRKEEAVVKRVVALAEQVRICNERIGKHYMPLITLDTSVTKGLKTLSSLNDKLDTELARCKILANDAADNIMHNLDMLRSKAAGFETLFPDEAQLVLKDAGDLEAVIDQRIAKRKAEDEAKRKREEQDRAAEAEKAALRSEGFIVDRPEQVTAPVSTRPSTSPSGTPISKRDPDEYINAVVARMREMSRDQQIAVLNHCTVILTAKAA